MNIRMGYALSLLALAICGAVGLDEANEPVGVDGGKGRSLLEGISKYLILKREEDGAVWSFDLVEEARKARVSLAGTKLVRNTAITVGKTAADGEEEVKVIREDVQSLFLDWVKSQKSLDGLDPGDQLEIYVAGMKSDFVQQGIRRPTSCHIPESSIYGPQSGEVSEPGATTHCVVLSNGEKRRVYGATSCNDLPDLNSEVEFCYPLDVFYCNLEGGAQCQLLFCEFEDEPGGQCADVEYE